MVAPGPIPAEELRRFFENLPKTWKVAQAVGMARAVREAGHEAPDLSAQEAHLESLLPMLREFGRTASGDDARTHFTVGYILNALGRTEEAEEPLRRAFALNPHSPTIVGELIATLADLGRVPEAIQVGRRALPLHVRHEVVPYQLAALLHSVGAFDEALAVLNGLLAAHPDHQLALRLQRVIQEASPGGPRSSD